MEHTKGVWVAVKSTESILDTVVDSNGDSICQLHNGALNFKPDEIESNALLIAPAPDLLEALEACFPYMHDLDAENFDDASAGIIEDYKLSEDFKKMKAALAKAKNVELAK